MHNASTRRLCVEVMINGYMQSSKKGWLEFLTQIKGPRQVRAWHAATGSERMQVMMDSKLLCGSVILTACKYLPQQWKAFPHLGVL